jgi:lipopolysaccharide heptosyltransferase I
MIHGVPRILVIRLSAIGDVVRVVPAVESIRESFPHAQIDWAVEPKSADVIQGHPALDNVLVFERDRLGIRSARHFLRFAREIRRNRYDIILDFHGILKSGLLTAFSKAPARYGFGRPRGKEFGYVFVNKRLKLGSAALNRVEENLRLSELLAPRSAHIEPSLYVPETTQAVIERFFEESFEGGKQVAAVHVPVDRPEKQWPIAHFARLCDMLLADGRFDVVLTWGPGQKRQVEEVQERSQRSLHICPEFSDIKHYIWVIANAGLYVGGDTGPMHIAAVMGTPVVALFGGTDPERHAPFRRPYEILTAEASHSGREDIARMTGAEKLALISADDVYDACIRVLFHQCAETE